jgi:CheY-like chemotaxis protein
VVEPDPELRLVLTECLEEGGYAVRAAVSLEEAAVRLDEQAFSLILAHLHAGPSPQALSDAHVLRRRAAPVPVALVTTDSQLTDAWARPAGFAYLQPLPFELGAFLARVAEALDRPLTPEQQRQAQVVLRFFAAREAEDLETLTALFSADVRLYPPADSLLVDVRRLQGRRAARDYFGAVASYYRNFTFTDVRFYATPHGLITRHTVQCETPDGRRHRAASSGYFHFADGLLCQIGMRVDLVRALGETLGTDDRRAG